MVSLKALNGKNWKTALLLSIVVPVSLLATFRLTGIIKEPLTIAKTINLLSKKWEFQRPNESVQFVYIDDELNASYIGDGLSANMYVRMGEYSNNALAYDGNDLLSILMVINATTSNPNSYIETLYVVVYKDQESILEWLETELYFENLSLTARADGYRLNTQAYIKLAGVNHTSGAYAEATAEWILLTPNTQSHLLEVAYEIVYYNGTAYNNVVQPFQLNIVERET